MTEVIDARFKPGGKQYSFNPNGLTIRPGQGVILSTTRGEEYGECTQGNHMVDETTLTAPLRPVLRLATEQDIRRRSEQARREKEAMRVCQEKIQAHGLEMKLVSCEYALDGSKILFFFTAENRVDFRALVKDLAGIFRARIVASLIAAAGFWSGSSPYPSKWPRPSPFPSTPPRSPGPAGGSCAASSMSRRPMRTRCAAAPSGSPSWRPPTGWER